MTSTIEKNTVAEYTGMSEINLGNRSGYSDIDSVFSVTNTLWQQEDLRICKTEGNNVLVMIQNPEVDGKFQPTRVIRFSEHGNYQGEHTQLCSIVHSYTQFVPDEDSNAQTTSCKGKMHSYTSSKTGADRAYDPINKKDRPANSVADGYIKPFPMAELLKSLENKESPIDPNIFSTQELFVNDGPVTSKNKEHSAVYKNGVLVETDFTSSRSRMVEKFNSEGQVTEKQYYKDGKLEDLDFSGADKSKVNSHLELMQIADNIKQAVVSIIKPGKKLTAWLENKTGVSWHSRDQNEMNNDQVTKMHHKFAPGAGK